jgi:hypothetical protein
VKITNDLVTILSISHKSNNKNTFEIGLSTVVTFASAAWRADIDALAAAAAVILRTKAMSEEQSVSV